MKKRLVLTLILVLTLTFAATALIIGVHAINGEQDAPELEWTGANLSFEENVHVLYSVGYKNVKSPENIKLLVWREAEGIHAESLVKGSEDYVLSVMPSAPAGLHSDSVAFKFTDVAAAEMTENIYTRAYYVEDGVEYYTPTLKYSVLQYALNKLGHTGVASESESFKAMLEGMLEYGALAQKHFDVNTDKLATDLFVKIKVNGATLSDGTSSGLFVAGTEGIVLTAKPTAEFPYIKWTDEDGRLLGYGDTYTIAANGHRTITATPVKEQSSFGAYKHVAIIGVDGAGTFWKDNTNTPNLDSIFQDGAITYAANIPTPTSSGPSWTSFLHGVPVENHGINDNSFVEDGTAFEGTDPQPWPMDSKYPSFLRVAKENLPEGANVGAIYGWQAFDNMIEGEAGIYKYMYSSKNQVILDEENTKASVNYVLENKPELFFMHIGNVDTVGHGTGFGTDAYFSAIETADEQIGRIYAAYEAAGILEDTLFIVTADHGGKGTSHGGLSDTEKFVMFAATGKTVAKDSTISTMYNRDAAAIALYALGIQAPETYTGIVPGGLFTETVDETRKEYNDPDSPRYHLTEETPVFGSKNDVTNFVENNLITYLPFDGSIVAAKGASTSSVGTIDYTNGYFGEAVDLSDGHVILSNFNPGTESFTISMWMKVPAAHLETTVLSNKAKGGRLTGIDFSLMRDTTKGWHQAKFNVGENGETYLNHFTYLPDDYQYGWTHVLLIVDRENATISTVFDFGEFSTAALEGDLSTSTLSAYGLYIGKDANNTQSYPKVDLSIDEFMIFDGAFTRNDVNDLADFYGKNSGIADDPTVIDKISGDADAYFNFDENTLNKVQDGINKNTVGTPTYVEGISGDAIKLGDAYVEFPDVKLGQDSFSAAFWINPQDLSFAGNNLEYVPLITTQAKYSGEALGFTFMMNTYSNRLLFNAGNGYTEDNGLEYVRTSISIPFPEDFLNNWTHIALVIDRTPGAEMLYIYVNFEVAYSARFVDTYHPTNVFDVPLDAYTLTFGQYSGGSFAAPPKAYLDDLILMKGVLTAEDMAALKGYYDEIIPEEPETPEEPTVKDVLSETPDFFLGFNENANSTGNSDAATLKGSASYVEGVDGMAMNLNGNYIEFPEYSIGTDSFSVAFWINPQDLTYMGANKEYVPLITTQSVYGGVKAGFTLMMETNNKFFMFNAGNGYTADNGLEKIRFNYCHNFPEGLLNNWTHIAIVIDRSAGNETFKLYINFEEVYSAKFNNMYASKVYDVSLDAETLTFGQYAGGGFAAPPKAYVDDLIITKGVLSAADIAAMADYYAK